MFLLFLNVFAVAGLQGLCNEPVIINDLNVRIYVPDMPSEYFKLPYPAAKSDMLRYGLLYHHGGIFLDLDVLAKVSDCRFILGRSWSCFLV